MRPLVIGTRASSLAVCQANLVRARLEERFPGREFRLQTIRVEADRKPDAPLAQIRGEGIFVKELEAALTARSIDLAVHSLKDMPLQIPAGLCLVAVLKRDEPRDAMITRSGKRLTELPSGARIGTSSLRRQSQLRRLRSDLELLDIRGNVDTRLRKLDEGHYDALVVAACGLIRLGLERRITELLESSVMSPEPGQGALAVEARTDDAETCGAVAFLDHAVSRACVEVERAFLGALGGGCRLPIAAYASADGEMLNLQGAVIAPNGSDERRGTLSGSITEPVALGERLARDLESQGARELLARKAG